MEAEQENNLADWPPILPFDGDWNSYEDALYEIFMKEVVKGGLTFLGLRIAVKRWPPTKDKHFTFWHMITEGDNEDERLPDLRRCERISWIKWMIERANTDPRISFWESKRPTSTNYVIWCEEHNYAVVLAKRSNYYLLTTAYPVSERRARAFKKELESYRKQQKS